MTPTYSISVLTMSNLPMSRQCVDTVLRTAPKGNCEILITLNGSKDGSLKHYSKLRDDGAPIRIIHHKENLGFILANEIAIKESRGSHFIFLNDDALPPDGWIEMLRAELDRHPKAEIVTTNRTCCGWPRGAKDWHGALVENLEYAELSCAMIRTDLIREFGLNSAFFKGSYGEDAHLSLSLRARGYTIHRAAFTINHKRGASSSQVPDIRAQQSHNNAWLSKRWPKYLKYRRLDLPIIIRRDGALGDCLLTTPLIRQIKYENPRSEIFVETKCPEIFKDNPHVAGVAESWQQHYEYSTHIDLNMAYENRPMTNFQDAYSQVAGYVIENHRPELFPSTFDKHDAEDAIPGDKANWLAVHMGPSWHGKMWPVDRWAELLHKLQKDWNILLVGTQGNEVMPCALDMRGKRNIHQTAALIERCSIFIGICSLPLHIAQAVGTPVVGLFGLSRSDIVLSRGCKAMAVDADPSHEFAGARHRVSGVTMLKATSDPMETISMAQVLKAVKKITK